MVYNNLIYLIVVIFILSSNGVPDTPQLPFWPALGLFFLKSFVFFLLIRFTYGRNRIQQSSDYFSAEQKLSIAAITSVAVDVYFLDCQYYFSFIPLLGSLPVLVSLGGIILFFFYLSLVWLGARKSYGVIFGRYHSASAFVKSNLKNNVPIILPWFLLSFTADILLVLPFPQLKAFMQSSWGEPLFFLTFFVVLAVVFPEVITRFWECKPMEQGLVRSHVEAFCRKQKLKYRDILIWPLFEGQMLTAGVMGLVKRFRYLLFTPALLRNLSVMEVDAVMAHEIGHVKRYHLQLYIVLLMGFSLIAQLGSYLFMYSLLKSRYFYRFSALLEKNTDTVLIFASTVTLLVVLIFYFRFIFGFFMRNFERQADIHALESMGSATGIVNALEKVAFLSGNIRDLPNWHHFGIAERVDFLERCQINSMHIKKHHRKVYGALLLYLFVLMGTGFSLWKMPSDLLERAPLEHLSELYMEKAVEEPKNPLWYQLFGDLQQGRKLYGPAVDAYEKALTLAPEHPEIMNNLAWILLTAEDESYRNPERGLMLARIAAARKPAGYIFDTLAHAYFQNGFPETAQEMERRAMEVDPDNKLFYLEQLEKFNQGESVQRNQGAMTNGSR